MICHFLHHFEVLGVIERFKSPRTEHKMCDAVEGVAVEESLNTISISSSYFRACQDIHRHQHSSD